jgi:hypothetical protein
VVAPGQSRRFEPVPAATGAGGQADAATPKADVLIHGGSEGREDVMDGGNLLVLWDRRQANERERKCLRSEC